MHFFSAKSLSHKFVTPAPVLFSPLPSSLLLSSQRCKEAFFFLSKTNSVLIHSPHNHLKTSILLPGQILHPLSKFSVQVDEDAALSYCILNTPLFSYCISTVCIYHKTETGNYLKKACIFMFISCYSRQCPTPNYLFSDF